MSVMRRGLPPSASPSASSALEHGRDRDVLAWLIALAGGALLVACVRLLGSPIGSLLSSGTPLHVLPAYMPQVMAKPAELGRFAVAVAVVLATAVAIILAPRKLPFNPAVRLVIVVTGQLAALATIAWAWQGQYEGVNRLSSVQFHSAGLVVAIAIAGVLTLGAARGWLGSTTPAPGRGSKLAWIGLASIVTALWLLPTLYRSLNLAHAMEAVWYPLQFTFDDFVSVLDGRTPLVNYDTQYASLMPFITEPVFKVFGASVATFTVLMGVLSLLAFLLVERSLAAVARDERTALLLYIPLLAVSLFTLRHVGNERYYMANYYEVMPIRYVGPYALLWCSIRHLAGKRPRRPASLFLLGGLVAINNTEFGVPALGGCVLAMASAQIVPSAGSLPRLRKLAGECVAGLALAVLVVSVFTLLRAGSLPQLARLTRYEQIYGITGFDLSPTPVTGLHIVIFMTFAATLVVAALRLRDLNADRLLTGALVFSGTFGLGAGSYYMGRSLPEVLAALFSAWGLATGLLCLLALQALRDPVVRNRLWPMRALPAAAVLILLGLFATLIVQFPLPWTQAKRLNADSHSLKFNTAPSVHFVAAATRPGEHVALLMPLGHLIGRDAGVIDVSPYSHPDGIVTYEQLDDVLRSLPAARGDALFTSAILPEVSQFLTARGFRVVAGDTASALSEWRRESPPGGR